jgi:hypothetical protein
VIPQENSIFGNVIETYDLLRLPEVGQGKSVQGEITLLVQHCLLVRKGVKMEEIGRLLSHEQVSRRSRCSGFVVRTHEGNLISGLGSVSPVYQEALSTCRTGEDPVNCCCCKGCTTRRQPREMRCHMFQNVRHRLPGSRDIARGDTRRIRYVLPSVG